MSQTEREREGKRVCVRGRGRGKEREQVRDVRTEIEGGRVWEKKR